MWVGGRRLSEGMYRTHPFVRFPTPLEWREGPQGRLKKLVMGRVFPSLCELIED